MTRINDIIEQRKLHPFYDDELWTFLVDGCGRSLINLPDSDLQDRLNAIDCNIQYLENGLTNRDNIPADSGWLSPWWWFRARHWTLSEFSHRGIDPAPTQEIAAISELKENFKGLVNGGRRMLIRISRVDWIMDALNHGMVRFAPASLYRDRTLNTARSDNELKKAYRRPGKLIKITGSNGEMKALGDVTFSKERTHLRGKELIETPYWMCSYSSDFDPRLFLQFESEGPIEDACLIIFDPDVFIKRALPYLNRAAPFALKSLFPTIYFDPYYPPPEELSVLASKEFRYAYQREMRLVIDPEEGSFLTNGDALFVNIGSITDIAGVYNKEGEKLAGFGPDNFYA